MTGGHFKAKHTQWGSRHNNTRKRFFYISILNYKSSFISPNKSTYWLAYVNRSPHILDFLKLQSQLV